MDFDKWYRTKIESQPEPPPGELWDAIQDDLDVEAVWARLGPGLAPARVRPLYQRLAVAASMLLLAAFSGLYFLGNWSGDGTELAVEPHAPGTESETRPPAIPSAAGTEQIAAAGTEQIAAAGAERFTETGTEQIAATTGISGPGELAATTGVYAQGGIAAATGIAAPGRIPASSRTLLAVAAWPDSPGQVWLYAREDILDPSDRDMPFSGAYVGVSGQLANTWLLNNKTINGLNPMDLTNTQASFGHNFGLRAGTKVGERSWLRLEWHFLSQSRQRYDEYINGQYVSTSMNLNYQSLSAAWHFRPGRAGSPHHLGAGLYAGLLKNAIQEVSGTSLDVAGNFSKTDYGILAGYEYVHRLSPGLTLSTGIHGKYGLNNVFAGDGHVPAYLNHTRNAALMLSFALNYDIW